MKFKQQHIPLLLVLLTLILTQCHTPEVKTVEKQPIDQKKLKDQFVDANKKIVQKENDEMDYYAKSHQMNFTKTTSGIRYYVYNPSAKGDSIKDEMEITLAFKVSLLNGEEVYNSKESGTKTFIVGQENIESGIHRGVKYLKKGDKALLLIPSYLAHGLLGDMHKIPPQMPIVYDISIN